MLENWIKPPAGNMSLKVDLTGLTLNDYKFFSTMVSIFTDPNMGALLDAIRRGDFAFQYGPKNGQPHVVDLKTDPPPMPPAAMIEFIARFKCSEWEKLKPHKKELFRLFDRGLEEAETFAERILGHLPRRVKLKICSE